MCGVIDNGMWLGIIDIMMWECIIMIYENLSVVNDFFGFLGCNDICVLVVC